MLMREREPHIFEVKVSQLKKLDSFVDNRGKMDALLGGRMDAHDDDKRFLLAAKVLYPAAAEVLHLLKPGQPGYAYAEDRRRIISVLNGGIPAAAHAARDEFEVADVQPAEPVIAEGIEELQPLQS